MDGIHLLGDPHTRGPLGESHRVRFPMALKTSMAQITNNDNNDDDDDDDNDDNEDNDMKTIAKS